MKETLYREVTAENVTEKMFDAVEFMREEHRYYTNSHIKEGDGLNPRTIDLYTDDGVDGAWATIWYNEKDRAIYCEEY